MSNTPTRRTVLRTLCVAGSLGTVTAAGTACTADASSGADAVPAPEAPTAEAGALLAEHQDIESRGGVLATRGDREFVWEEIEADDRSAETVVDVDLETQMHPIEGFGPALTHSAAWLLLRMESSTRQELLRSMFSPDGPLRLNALRIPLGTCDFAPEEPTPRFYTFADEEGPADDRLAGFSIERDEDSILPVLREIAEQVDALTVVMSPWSAPAWMKTSGDLVGGSLIDDEDTVDLYAQYLARSAAAYEEAVPGLSVQFLTVQNEPLHDEAAYPCMGMTPDAQVEVITRTREHLESAGLSTQVLSYDHNWDRVDYPLTVLDALAERGIDDVGACFHAYDGTADAVDPLHEAHPEARIWFTEQSGTQNPDQSYEEDFSEGLWWMSNQLFLPALRHHHRGVVLFNLVLDQDGGPGPETFTNGTGLVQVDEGTGALTPNSELYVLGHMSRFMPAGSTVVEATTSEDLPTVAVLREDGAVVVALYNNGTTREIAVQAGDRRLTSELPEASLATFVLAQDQQADDGQ